MWSFISSYIIIFLIFEPFYSTFYRCSQQVQTFVNRAQRDVTIVNLDDDNDDESDDYIIPLNTSNDLDEESQIADNKAEQKSDTMSESSMILSHADNQCKSNLRGVPLLDNAMLIDDNVDTIPNTETLNTAKNTNSCVMSSHNMNSMMVDDNIENISLSSEKCSQELCKILMTDDNADAISNSETLNREKTSVETLDPKRSTLTRSSDILSPKANRSSATIISSSPTATQVTDLKDAPKKSLSLP